MIGTLTRKERDRLQKEEEFLNVAEKMFSERGYFQTSMEDLARAAEYATGTLYRYFPSKTDLYNRLLLRKGKTYFEEMKAAVSLAQTPQDQLHALILGKVRFFLTHREFLRIYMTEVARPACGSPSGEPDDLNRIHQQYQDLLTSILKTGMKQGSIRKVDVPFAAALVNGFTQEVLNLVLRENISMNETKLMQTIFGLLREGLIQS